MRLLKCTGVAVSMAFLNAAAPPQTGTYEPAPGSSERVAIMDALRDGTHATSTFMVDHLRVNRSYGISIAYAEVHPVRENSRHPFTGWTLLSKTESNWNVLWGVASGGVANCDKLANFYKDAKAIARKAEAEAAFFSQTFNQDARQISNAPAGTFCVGDLVVGPSQVGRP